MGGGIATFSVRPRPIHALGPWVYEYPAGTCAGARMGCFSGGRRRGKKQNNQGRTGGCECSGGMYRSTGAGIGQLAAPAPWTALSVPEATAVLQCAHLRFLPGEALQFDVRRMRCRRAGEGRGGEVNGGGWQLTGGCEREGKGQHMQRERERECERKRRVCRHVSLYASADAARFVCG